MPSLLSARFASLGSGQSEDRLHFQSQKSSAETVFRMELEALECSKKQFAVKIVAVGSLLQIIKLNMSEKKMRKRHLATAVFLGASLIASAALAQPSVNGPSGTGPEGSGTSISGSGQNGPGTGMSRHGASTKMTKHHSSKKSENNKM